MKATKKYSFIRLVDLASFGHFPRSYTGVPNEFVLRIWFSTLWGLRSFAEPQDNSRLRLRVGFVWQHSMPAVPLRVRSSHQALPLVEFVRIDFQKKSP